VGKGCIAVPKYSTTQNIKINKISQQRAETINLQWTSSKTSSCHHFVQENHCKKSTNFSGSVEVQWEEI
jgi:hypothetical protein